MGRRQADAEYADGRAGKRVRERYWDDLSFEIKIGEMKTLYLFNWQEKKYF